MHVVDYYSVPFAILYLFIYSYAMIGAHLMFSQLYHKIHQFHMFALPRPRHIDRQIDARMLKIGHLERVTSQLWVKRWMWKYLLLMHAKER